MRKKIASAISLSALIFLGASFTFAQGAWVAPKGSGSISFSYQNYFVDRHIFGNGDDFVILNGERDSDIGTLRFQAAYVDLSYSFTDNLGLTVSLPYITGKYTAPLKPPIPGFGPHAFADGSIPLDDGHYHGGFQDFTFRARYKIAARPIVVTPFVQYGFPSHGYQYYSHDVIGNRVSEFEIGSYFGRTLDPFLSNAYFNFGYGLGFPQRILGISRIHHHAEFEGGILRDRACESVWHSCWSGFRWRS